MTTWEIETLPLVEAQDMRQKMMDTMVLALMAMAATGIANTVLMAAYERIREIGTLQAMGMTREGVVGMFVAEGFLMGLVGATGGALLGGGAVWWWATHGIDLGPMIEANSKGGGYDSVAFSTMLYLNFSWPTIAVAIAFGVAVAVLASVYPAVLASRLAPADAVRAS